MREISFRVLVAAVLTLLAVGSSISEASAQEPNFGRAIALTDSELFIGQPVNWYGPGVVYAYTPDAAGEWVESARLTAPDEARMDDFGRAIAVDGNTMVVGAPRKRDGSGVAYAFERASADAEWREAGVIEPPAEGDHSGYAMSLALAGGDLYVGAPAVDATGVVYHFRRADGAWTLRDVIRPGSADDAADEADEEDGPSVAGFGATLSLDGDRLLVGAPAADSNAGRVYFYERGADGTWTEARSVTPVAPVIGPRAGFGSAVLLDGDRAFIGVPGEGRVIEFARTGDGDWTPARLLQPFEGDPRAQFGHALAVADGELWVGAPGVNRGNGRVYRYVPGADGEWQSASRFDAEGADGTSWRFAYGFSIAAAGQHAVVGMPMRDFGEGRALVAARDGDGWTASQTLEGEIYRIGESLTSGDRCADGRLGEFPCDNMELIAHMPISELGGERGVWVNDVWGWSDAQTGRDYALVARRDGVSFVDVTDPSAPRLVGNLPRTRGSPPTVWRDIKVLNDHAYVVADGAGDHGVQVFDLARLRELAGAPGANQARADLPAIFEPDTTYHEIASAHNIVADTTSGFLYVVGANGGGETCGGGLHMIDAREPTNLSFAGCYNDTSGANPRGYTHDAQCLVYEGPDAAHRGRQICVGSNEREINIADVTDKSNPTTIGRGTYPNAAYTHQGWFDAEQRYFYQNDEIDELQGTVDGTRTIVWDLSELDDPIVANEYIGPVMASDHNLFVKGDRMYQSNYGSGLRVLDISDRANPREIAFFDSAPLNDDGPGHSSSESGAWSNYPFFDGDFVVFTSVREGLFIMRVAEDEPVS
ncbi:MAG TPA: choice-of-anchor B family protein [Gemmatimonadota bacterium]|nr:choice-of-anchor B family protein [Gemmatimonadota bacterium]